MIDVLKYNGDYLIDIPYPSDNTTPLDKSENIEVKIALLGEVDVLVPQDNLLFEDDEHLLQFKMDPSYFPKPKDNQLSRSFHQWTIKVFVDGKLYCDYYKEFYLEYAPIKLIAHQNSFASYRDLMMIAGNLMGFSQFVEAEHHCRVSALVDAYTQMRDVSICIVRNGREFNYHSLRARPEFLENQDALTSKEKIDFSMAQIYQANFILGGYPHEQYRKSGIIQQTSGSSMTMWRAGKPLENMLCKHALLTLKPYIRNGVKLSRT